MSKYIRVYETLCPDDIIARDDPRRDSIMSEMRGIHRASTDDVARKIVEWWGVWPNPCHDSALEFVQAARRLLQHRRPCVTSHVLCRRSLHDMIRDCDHDPEWIVETDPDGRWLGACWQCQVCGAVVDLPPPDTIRSHRYDDDVGAVDPRAVWPERQGLI